MNTIRDMRLELYSHFFKIINPSHFFQKIIDDYNKQFLIFEKVKATGEAAKFLPTKVFAGRSKDKKEYRFHLNQLEEVLELLKQKAGCTNIPTSTIPLYTPAKLKYPVNIVKHPRDYQIVAIERIKSPVANKRTVMLGLPTGTGKTFCGLVGSFKIGTRLALIILPIYIDKWVQDIQENLGVTYKAITIVQGMKHLVGIIDMAKNNNLNSDYIIISTVTMRMFVDAYDSDPKDCEEQYGCTPIDFYKTLKIGQVMIDETHQHLHAIYKILIQMHVPHLTALTATLASEHPVIKKIYNILFPKIVRYDELLMERYINVQSIAYEFKNYSPKLIRTEHFGDTVYSHIAFEKSILRKQYLLNSYLSMIEFFINKNYITRKDNKDKILIYISTKLMANEVVSYLKTKFSNLNVVRYMESDPYTNISEGDIIVSTIVSAGTALDIPNLLVVLNTVNISSPIANIQTLGRLRKQPGKEVEFIYFYCSQIKKHYNNNQTRKEIFKDRCASIKELTYPVLL